MYILDVSTSSRALLANSNAAPSGSRPLCPDGQTKSHRVRTTTVEKADAGTPDRCLGSVVFFPWTRSSNHLNVGYVLI